VQEIALDGSYEQDLLTDFKGIKAIAISNSVDTPDEPDPPTIQPTVHPTIQPTQAKTKLPTQAKTNAPKSPTRTPNPRPKPRTLPPLRPRGQITIKGQISVMGNISLSSTQILFIGSNSSLDVEGCVLIDNENKLNIVLEGDQKD